MQIKINEVRTLTTGLLHTEVLELYKSLEAIVGEPGIMTHQIPSAMKALIPFLRKRITDNSFWDKKFDPTDEGFMEIEPLSFEEKKLFFNAFKEEMQQYHIKSSNKIVICNQLELP